MSLRQVGIGSLSLLSACLSACLGAPVLRNASTGGTQDSGLVGWQGSAQTAAAAPAAYAIVDDEQGPYYAVVGIAGSGSGADSCAAALAATSTQVPLGQWTLELATPAAPGEYAVLSAQGDPIYPNIGAAGAVVRLVQLVSSSSALQLYPVSGSVTVVAGPASLTDERNGVHLTGSYHLGFAFDPLQANCSYAGATFDLGDQVIDTDYVCTCDAIDGQPVSSCDGGGGNFVGCCFQTAPAGFTLDGTFDAVACLGLCVAPLGIPKACHPLQADGG